MKEDEGRGEEQRRGGTEQRQGEVGGTMEGEGRGDTIDLILQE